MIFKIGKLCLYGNTLSIRLVFLNQHNILNNLPDAKHTFVFLEFAVRNLRQVKQIIDEAHHDFWGGILQI